MKKGLMIVVLGLVLAMTGMGEARLPIYPTVPSYMTGTWKTVIWDGTPPGGFFVDQSLSLVISGQGSDGLFYGSLWGGDYIGEGVYVTGSIDDNRKDVTMTMTTPPVNVNGAARLVTFKGKLHRNQLKGTLTYFFYDGSVAYTLTGKIIFTEATPQ
jgi:hypothetical protein